MSLAGWSLDFCLSCDKQIEDGLYCSQACRLADYQRGQPSTEHTSNDRYPSVSSDSSSTSAPVERSMFWLPPKIDFKSSKLKSHTVPSTPKARTVQHRQDNRQCDPRASWRLASRHIDSSMEELRLDMPSSTKPRNLLENGLKHMSETTREELRRYDDAFEHSVKRRERKQSRP